MQNRSQSTEAEERFEALVKEYGRFLRGVIVQVCPKNLGLQINDIEQEARFRLWRALRSERKITDPASYIYRIAVSTTIDATRRVIARHEEQLQPEDEREGCEEDIRSLAADPDRSPERVAERRQLILKIEGALARLPDNRRLAVEFYLEGMTTQEMAELLDWTEPKARNLLYRGLKDLRRHLKDEGIDYD